MTEREKAVFSDRLFDEIGLIDDRFIYEASTPYVPKRRFGAIGKILVIAAALTLSLCVIASTLLTGALFLFGDLGVKGDEDVGTPPTGNTEDVADKEESGFITLSDRLDGVTESAYASVSKESIALFDSKPKIVWEINASKYYVCEISEGRARSLIEKMRVGGTKAPSGEAQGESSTSVWIILGNGQVITPHLELTSGNVGYGELFDYEKEYEPSEDFSNLLIDTVS